MPTEGPALPTGGLIYLQRGLLGMYNSGVPPMHTEGPLYIQRGLI